MSIILYHSPGACSRVTMNALEEIGLTYEDRGLSLLRGEQKKPDYLAINPKGKVSTLVIDDRVLTENPAIIFQFARIYPDAGLLPALADHWSATQGLSDLIWCGGTLQPIVGRLMRPALYSEKDAAGVHENAITHFTQMAATVSERLSNGRWWYGDNWSIVDVYLYWAYSVAAYAGFPLANYPALEEHTARVVRAHLFNVLCNARRRRWLDTTFRCRRAHSSSEVGRLVREFCKC